MAPCSPLRAPMNTRILPSGLNPPLLALLVDLRYSISIFVRRLLVTKNISRGATAPFALGLTTPLGQRHASFFF